MKSTVKFQVFLWLPVIVLAFWAKRNAQGNDPSENLNTNLIAAVTATAVSDHEIRLDLSATNLDGGEITGWHVYQNGVWIADVPAPPQQLASPTNLKVY